MSLFKYKQAEISDYLIKDKGIIPQIIERAFKGKPLTDEQTHKNILNNVNYFFFSIMCCMFVL